MRDSEVILCLKINKWIKWRGVYNAFLFAILFIPRPLSLVNSFHTLIYGFPHLSNLQWMSHVIKLTCIIKSWDIHDWENQKNQVVALILVLWRTNWLKEFLGFFNYKLISGHILAICPKTGTIPLTRGHQRLQSQRDGLKVGQERRSPSSSPPWLCSCSRWKEVVSIISSTLRSHCWIMGDPCGSVGRV